jgi:hypothetical protein
VPRNSAAARLGKRHGRGAQSAELEERGTGDQRERRADEEAGSRDEGAGRADWAS